MYLSVPEFFAAQFIFDEYFTGEKNWYQNTIAWIAFHLEFYLRKYGPWSGTGNSNGRIYFLKSFQGFCSACFDYAMANDWLALPLPGDFGEIEPGALACRRAVYRQAIRMQKRQRLFWKFILKPIKIESYEKNNPIHFMLSGHELHGHVRPTQLILVTGSPSTPVRIRMPRRKSIIV